MIRFAQRRTWVINDLMTCAKRLLVVLIVIAGIAAPTASRADPRTGLPSPATPVINPIISGKLLTSDGQPAAGRPIHFEQQVSGDIYLTSTNSDGTFSVAVPPGIYDLRDERGPIIAGPILARDQNISLGAVSEPAPYRSIFQGEGIAPSRIRSPAATTANVVPGQMHGIEPARKITDPTAIP